MVAEVLSFQDRKDNPFYLQRIRSAMNVWRRGLGPMPEAYVKLHEKAAWEDMDRFAKEHGLRIIATEMIPQGWMDGMKVLRLVCDDRLGSVCAFRWSDSGGGTWVQECPSGGTKLMEKSPLAPGFL